MDIHKKEICLRRLIRCEYCDRVVERCQMIAHREECSFFRIPYSMRRLLLGVERDWSVNRVERRPMDIPKKEICPRRLIKCIFCGIKVESCHVNAHLKVCEDRFIPCPNACQIKENKKRLVKRRDMVRHVTEECSLQKVECKECKAEFERFMLEKHNIECPMRVIEINNSLLQVERNQIIEKSIEFRQSEKSGQMRWIIVDAKKSIENGAVRNSLSFDASHYKFQSRIYFNDRNSGYVGCYIRILRGNSDSFLNWPFRGRYTFTLINHENKDKNHSKCILAGRDEDPIQHFSKPISHSNGLRGLTKFILSSKLLTKQYLQNDSITLDIRVDAIC